MSKRITVVLEDDLDAKLRDMQAKFIKEVQGSYSFSKTLNGVLRKGLIKQKK